MPTLKSFLLRTVGTLIQQDPPTLSRLGYGSAGGGTCLNLLS